MPKGALLFQAVATRHEMWTDHLRRLMPELDIRIGEEDAQPADIVYCVAWKPKPGSLKRYPNLKVVFSMAPASTASSPTRPTPGTYRSRASSTTR